MYSHMFWKLCNEDRRFHSTISLKERSFLEFRLGLQKNLIQEQQTGPILEI